jgi:hypothetical protein
MHSLNSHNHDIKVYDIYVYVVINILWFYFLNILLLPLFMVGLHTFHCLVVPHIIQSSIWGFQNYYCVPVWGCTESACGFLRLES